MPLSSNINAYADVAAVLLQSLPHGRVEYRLATPGAARHWMQRANKYRQLLQAQVKSTSPIKGYVPPTAYDRMKMRIIGSVVEIDFNPSITGELMLPSGKKIVPRIDPLPTHMPSQAPATPQPLSFAKTDELAEMAALLAEKESDED